MIIHYFAKSTCLLLLAVACGGPGNSSSPKSKTGTSATDAQTDGRQSSSTPLFQVVTSCPLPYPEQHPATTTFRVPFTSMRSGSQARVAIWGSSSATSIKGVWIGSYPDVGTVESNIPVTFAGGQSTFNAAANQVVVSDEVAFNMVSGQRYAVSLVVSGGVPASQDIYNDGVTALGNLGASPSIDGDQDQVVHGLKWVSVLGDAQRVIAVLGDSIGAGMAAGGLDLRFIALAQRDLGYPVVDASVGGDGVERSLYRMDADLLALPGVTDCVVQSGTNDLHRGDPQYLIDNLTKIYTKLRASGIHPWGATIMPKGRGVLTSMGEQARKKVNQFILSTDLVDGVVDFAAGIADPANPSRPMPGMLSRDGIHPSAQGHEAMANQLVNTFRGR